ncbi:hypothetical protein JQM63_12160 [Oscillibacter valericigenes]|nr:hypothetical protein [Oscillibacter valericigenes]
MIMVIHNVRCELLAAISGNRLETVIKYIDPHSESGRYENIPCSALVSGGSSASNAKNLLVFTKRKRYDRCTLSKTGGKHNDHDRTF